MNKKQLFDLDQIEEVWVIYFVKGNNIFEEVCRSTNQNEAERWFKVYEKSTFTHVLMKRFQFRD